SPRGKFRSEEETGESQAEVIQGVSEGELLQTLNKLVEENKPGIARIVSNLAFVSERLTQTDNVLGALINDAGTGSNLAQMAADIADSANHLQRIMKRIDQGDGVLGELVVKKSALHDNVNSAVANLNGSLDEAHTMLLRANEGKSALGVLVSEDPEVTAAAHNIVHDISVVTSDVAAGKGSLGQLVKDDRLYNGLASTSENIAVITSNIRESRSAVGVLFNDEGSGTAIKSTLEHLDSISRSVDQGNGAFGMVVKDQLFRDRVARIFTE